MKVIVKCISAAAVVAGLAVACGSPEAQQEGVSQPVEAFDLEARFGSEQLLDVIAASDSQNPMRLPPGVGAQQVEAAFNGLSAKLKARRADPSQLDVDPIFAGGLSAAQRRGLDKVVQAYKRRIEDGSIRAVRQPNGDYAVAPGDGRNRHQGQGRSGEIGDHAHGEDAVIEGVTPEHAVGNGWWSWSTSYRWWGVKVSLNHNFLWYLCRYTSWMLDHSGLSGWIKTALRLLLCLPHNADTGADGAAVYITWAGIFWYSA